MKDAKVSSAISHWAPRFVSNGVLLADFEDVTGSIERWEDWCAAWCARAKVHEDLGRSALNEKYFLTGGEHLIRAGIYYHFAKFVFVQDVKQMKAAHMKAVACYGEGVKYARPPGERVEIAFSKQKIFGILRKPTANPSPVLVMAPFSPEWRYGIAGEVMPWYPSVRVFRQPAYGDWDAVINHVTQSLRQIT